MCREEPLPVRIRTGGGAGERQGSSILESGDRGAKPVAPLSERLEIPSGPMAEPVGRGMVQSRGTVVTRT